MQAAPKSDPAQAHVAAQWKYADSPLIFCRVEPKGRLVLAGAQDRTVQRFDATSGKLLAPLAGHESWVRAIGFAKDGETTYTGGYDGQLFIWPTMAEKPTPTKKIAAHDGWVRDLAVCPDGKLIATAGNDNLVKLWNAADGQPVRTLTGHDRHVYSVMFHPGGQFVISGDLRGQVHQWEVASGKLVRTLDAKALYTPNRGQDAEYGGVRSIAFAPDAKHVAFGGLYKGENPFGAVQEPLALVFEWESGKLVQSHIAEGGLKGIIWRVVYHPDGYLIGGCGGSGGGHLLFWKREAANTFHRLKLPNTVLDMDIFPDALQLATVHHDRQVRVCRLAKKA